jgi:hypothetical protein
MLQNVEAELESARRGLAEVEAGARLKAMPATEERELERFNTYFFSRPMTGLHPERIKETRTPNFRRKK